MSDAPNTPSGDPWRAPPPAAGAAPAREDPRWERSVLERLLDGWLREQQRARRWSIFFRAIVIAYLFLLLFLFVPPYWAGKGGSSDRHTALIDIAGVISEDEVTADLVISGLRAAFEDERTQGVILRINSPGGSPVQAGQIHDEILRLRKLNPEVPVYAVITDLCASGGYYVAAAADRIYADKASVVGSIGVLMNGFGFTESMKKLGIERRLITAGEHKGFLDPFSPLKPDELTHVRGMLDDIHRQFVDAVKRGRGERLKDDPRLFSGLMWTGAQGMELGLVDALASPGTVAREVIGAEDVVDYTPKPDFLERFADRIGVVLSDTLGRQMAGRVELR